MQDGQQVIEEIRRLFARFGHETYEEKCTQLQHAEQSGTLALEAGADEEFALAAFLHDIGHFLAQDSGLQGWTRFGHADHAALAADYLRASGFSDRVVSVVGEHVQAKRYLAATDPDYRDGLSHASTETLKHQGGVMNEVEVERFRQLPNLQEILLLRHFDDSGKQPEMACRKLSYWLEVAGRSLRRPTVPGAL